MNNPLKIVSYVCLNAGVLIWACVFVLEGMSVAKGIITLAFSLGFVNLLIWAIFSRKESGRK